MRVWFDQLSHDVKLGARLIVRAPGFSATAILTFALGIGASTAIFSQVNAVLWKKLPVARPNELRLLLWSSRNPSFLGGPNVIAGPDLPSGPTYGSFSYIAYRALRGNAAAFSDLACWTDLGETRPVVMRDVGFGSVQFVSGNYFDILGVRAERGRLLARDDDAIGTTAAVVSHSFWQRQFGGDAAVTSRRSISTANRSRSSASRRPVSSASIRRAPPT
jgi:MacB-like periplasmic core domain